MPDDRGDAVSLRGGFTGCSWSSSARVVRCWVKSRNERNPRRVLPAGPAGNSRGTAGVNSEEGGDDVRSSCPLRPGLHACYNGRYNGVRHGDVGPHVGPPGLTRRKVGMTSDHHAPYVQGFTHATMAGTTGCDTLTWGGSLITGLSSDRSLQLDCVKVGGDDVRSSCPLRPGLHACYNGRYNGVRHVDVGRIPDNRSQFGSQSATRLREGGVASYPGSATPR